MKTPAAPRSLSLTLTAGLALLLWGGFGCSRESQKADHLARAEAFLQQEKYAQAEIEFVNVLRLEQKENPDVIGKLGAIYLAQGRYPQAYIFLKKAKELEPDNLDTRINLALLNLTQRQFTNALPEIEFVLQRQPTNEAALEMLAESAQTTNAIPKVLERLAQLRPQAEQQAGFHAALGKVYFRARDFPRAQASFQRALELNPKLSSARWGMGSVYLRQSNYAQAEKEFAAAQQLTPVRSSQRLNYANYKIISGDVAAGKRLLQEIVEQAPDYLPALTRLANLDLAETNYAECEALLAKVTRQDSMNVDAILLSARLQLARGEKPKAIEELEKLCKLYPGAAAAFYHLGVVQLSNGDTAKARRNLEQAVALNPDFAEAVYVLAELELRLKDTLSAVTRLQDFLQRYPTAVRARFMLARAYQASGRADDAVALCVELVEQGYRNPQVPLFAGMIFRQQKKTAEAKAWLLKTLDLAPGYLPAIQQLVALDVEQKNWASALKRLQDHIAQAPQSAALRFLLATVHLAQGDFKAAETALLKAIELDPEAGAPYQALARLYLKTNQAPKALAQLDQRLARNPDDLTALLTKALIHEQLQQYAPAKMAYERILAVKPKSGTVQNNLAYLLSEHFHDLDQAYTMAQKAYANRPHDPAVADTLGWILYQRGDYAKALSLLRESGEKLGTVAEVQYHLALALFSQGYVAQALDHMRQVLQLDAAFAQADAAKRFIAMTELYLDPARANDASGQVQDVLAEHPDDAPALAVNGLLKEKQRNIPIARQSWEQVLKRYPDFTPAHQHLASLYIQVPLDYAKAREHALKAQEAQPGNEAVAKVLKIVKQHFEDSKRAGNLLKDAFK